MGVDLASGRHCGRGPWPTHVTRADVDGGWAAHGPVVAYIRHDGVDSQRVS